MKQMQPAGNKHTRADIKWIRLQEICRSTAGCGLTVELHASTDIPANTRAEVLKEGHRVDIVLNMLYNKTLDDVIDSLAHEMTHIVPGVGDEGHGTEFSRKWNEVRKMITQEYQMRDEQFLVTEAERLAKRYHSGQKDRRGQPYIRHVRRVAAAVPKIEEKTIAWLHDILEDTAMKEGELGQKFPAEIVEAVSAITRRKKEGEEYEKYIRRLARNPLAV